MTLPFTHSSIQKTKKNRLTSHVWQVKMFSGSSSILKFSQALQMFWNVLRLFKYFQLFLEFSLWLGVRALVPVQTQMSLARLFCPFFNIKKSAQLLSVLTPPEMSEICFSLNFSWSNAAVCSDQSAVCWRCCGWHTRVDRTPQCSTVRWIIMIINAWMRKRK